MLDANRNGGEAFAVAGVSRLDENGKIADQTGEARRTWNEATKTLALTYPWGRVFCRYQTGAERLDMDVKVENASPNTIAGLNVFPVALHFGGFPRDADGSPFDASTPHVNFNADGPTVQSADFGAGSVTLVNRDTEKTLAVGFLSTSETPQTLRWNVYIGSAPLWYQPDNWPKFTRPIAPSQSDLYRISLRFSPPGADLYGVAADVYAQFAATHPFEVNWPDRRPIGALFLASAGDTHPANNPRGWFYNDADINVSTPQGRARLRERVLKFADESIAVLRQTGAQGAITWDIEGQQFPHAISYIGDPRMLRQLAPEMDEIADAYFKKLRDAGLRVGVCVRPQQLTFDANGAPDQRNVADETAQLNAKIRYARQRWGASLFYVDSNGGPYDPSDAEVFRRVLAANPDVLLMPEHQNFKYQVYSAPYNDLRFESSITPAAVRRTYPRAFSVINGEAPQLEARHDELVRAVRAGDVLVFNAWYPSRESELVRQIYAQAARP